MKPDDPVGKRKIKLLHILFSRIGEEATAEVRAEIEAGRLRPDLDPGLTALSMISLALFPFVGLPVSGPVFGIDTSDAVVRRLVEHTASLFYQGAANPAPALGSDPS